jgi:uncharacterized protein (DUF1015 family)
VPRFEPFSALRYANTGALGDLCAPPYDVQSDIDRERYGLRNPHNIVHVDMPIGSDEDDARYHTANDTLQEWKKAGVMVRDASPTFTIYRMEFHDSLGRLRKTVGVLGGLEVVDEGAGGVLPHERTTPKAKTDRLQLTRATKANLSPVWGLSLAAGLTALLEDPAEPMGHYRDDNGVKHVVERLSDPVRIAAIAELVASKPVVIADGHHRYAISRTYRDETRQSTGSSNTGAELTLTYVNELIDEQLSVAAIHRLYCDVSITALTQALEGHFHVEPVATVEDGVLLKMNERGALFLLDPTGSGVWLTPRLETFTGVRDLDSARLEHALAGTSHTVEYQHGLDEVRLKVDSGNYSAAILIRPVSVDEIRRTAHEGLLMPPKSTFFTPKLQTGLVVRELD